MKRNLQRFALGVTLCVSLSMVPHTVTTPQGKSVSWGAIPLQAAVTNITLNKAVTDTADYMKKMVQNPQVGSIGGEWAVLGLARSGYQIGRASCRERVYGPV